MNPAEKSQHMRAAALTRWGLEADRTKATAKARRAAEDRFLSLADPEGVLSEGERAKRAESLRRAHYVKMSIASAKARRRRA